MYLQIGASRRARSRWGYALPMLIVCAFSTRRVPLSRTAMVFAIFLGACFTGCAKAQPDQGSAPEVRVSLAPQGLPKTFFRLGEDTKCSDKIIGYRFVVWLDSKNVAVGFNTSPNCRVSPTSLVTGSARILVFDIRGNLEASRDVGYPADGNGELVADGAAMPGPGNTLLFRIQSVNLDPSGATESKSGVLLLDRNLKDIDRVYDFLEQTTFLDHAMVFQQGFTSSGPRNYSVLSGNPPKEIEQWTEDWPTGTMDRKFGEHQIAYMLCQQELKPNTYTASNIIYAGAKRRCAMTVQDKAGSAWNVPLKEEGTAAIIGVLPDGSVAGQLNVRGGNSGQLVIWKRDRTTEALPWLASKYSGSVQSAVPDMSRYATFVTDDGRLCEEFARGCSDNGRWIVFDRKSSAPIVNRTFPKNGRAALSPDGTHYASFEAGKLRIYSLPKTQ